MKCYTSSRTLTYLKWAAGSFQSANLDDCKSKKVFVQHGTIAGAGLEGWSQLFFLFLDH